MFNHEIIIIRLYTHEILLFEKKNHPDLLNFDSFDNINGLISKIDKQITDIFSLHSYFILKDTT